MKFHARSPNNDIALPTKTVPEKKKLNLAIGQVSASKKKKKQQHRVLDVLAKRNVIRVVQLATNNAGPLQARRNNVQVIIYFLFFFGHFSSSFH